MSGKFGVKGGCYRAQNNQAGIVSVTTDSSGNGSATATFRQVMKGIPAVIPGFTGSTSADALTTGNVTSVSITPRGFKAVVKGASVKSGTVKVAYNAFDDAYR